MNITHNAKILITGARGLVATALIEELKKQGYLNLYPISKQECDLRDFHSVQSIFSQIKPDVVFHTAASVFGIGGNAKNQGSIFLDNILINTHVIEASRLCKAKKVICMGTVAAYPEPKTEPVSEDQIWEGPPHKSESSYGHAKRAMLAQLLAYYENYNLDFAYVISTNLYGQNDKFDTKFGHVIPSLIRKFYEAQKNDANVTIWGDGTAARDFLYSKDMARALILIMNNFSGPINVASGEKQMLRNVVELLCQYFNMHNKVQWDTTMPNGRRYYEIDLTRLKSIGFQPIYTMEQGLIETLEWFSSVYEQNAIRT